MSKSLSLYIDKWYIIGAVCTDGIICPICLPNHEDRIWLYFYEDIVNDEISYGKGFQRNFRNNELHYYGDVFSIITQSSAKYTMFKRSQPMRGIFKSAKIFDDLRNEMEEGKGITTYVSFSQDISFAARLIFLDELKDEGFIVKEHVARIDHLALEYSLRKKNLNKNGYYLVLNACNENLYYSLYLKTEDLFVRVNEEKLVGLGTDVRSRALIEDIVDKINDKEPILKTTEERESEYLRMTQFVDNWIVRLSTARGGIPVHITDITFSSDPYKSYSVQVRKAKIDERTEKTVKDIINVVAQFIKNENVKHEQVCGVIFLGNTFTNVQFRKEIGGFYNLSVDKIISYKDIDLSSIVSAYTFIDCEQFSTATNNQRKDAEAELLRIKNAEEEEISRQNAEKEERLRIEEERTATDSDKKYKEACDRGFDFEKKHDYDQMLFYFGTALDFKPNDEIAKQKHEEAQQLKAKQTVLLQNYNKKIHLAKQAIENGDYETAKQKSVEALSDISNSKEAIDIKNRADRHIKHTKELESILVRADVFIAQKTYKEALIELEKAKTLDLNSDFEIKQRIELIKKNQEETTNRINQLVVLMNQALDEKIYANAISICNELLDIDFLNSRKWSAKIADIHQTQEREQEQKKQLKKLLTDIDSAWYNEEWSSVVSLCKNVLAIKKNDDIKIKLKKAEEKLFTQRKLQELDSTITQIKDLILASEFNEAKEKLNELRCMSLDSTHEQRIKELNKLIFQKEDEAEDKKHQKSQWIDDFRELPVAKTMQKPKIITGFTPKKAPSKPIVPDFDFNFGLSSNDKKDKRGESQKSSPKRLSTNKKDFFDSANKNNNKLLSDKSKESNGKVNNNDFNF